MILGTSINTSVNMKDNLSTEKEICSHIFESIDFEKIIDHPNILIAAAFWDEERYQAARTCYKFMRYIDDFIDDYKSGHKTIPEAERLDFEKHVSSWIASILHPGEKGALFPEITATMRQFHIPAWPMEAFAKSMIYDIYHDGFPSLQEFLNYSTGASVAPASIFVHLCGVSKKNGIYTPPVFEVKPAAEPCAIFSYLVHIIRDFVKDHTHNLNYFPEDMMREEALDRTSLSQMAAGTIEITPGFRSMTEKLYTVAYEYKQKTIDIKKNIEPLLDIRSALSLEIIFSLYNMVFERIDIKQGKFTTEELNPTPAEVKARVWQTIEDFFTPRD